MTIHEHAHTHDGDTHVHLHVHGDHDHAADGSHGHKHAALGMGVLHGLAGAGHFWAVLPSLAMPPRTAAIYIVSYILASLVIMSAFAAVISRASSAFGVAWVPRFLGGVGVVTVGVGVRWSVMAF